MKKIIIKTLSLGLAVIFILLSLMSCDPTTDQGEQNGGNNNTNGGSSSTSHYYGVKTLYSYDDVMDALAIVRQRRTVKPTYTVKDMGEDYTIFYQFLVNHCWTEYPIDYDTYFNTKSDGFFTTHIFFENQSCSSKGHFPGHTISLEVYKEDEDYDKIMKYMKENACITINVVRDCRVTEIGHIMNLSYSCKSNDSERLSYTVRFRGIEIMYIYSCVGLDDAFFELLFENIVTTSVKD